MQVFAQTYHAFSSAFFGGVPGARFGTAFLLKTLFSQFAGFRN